MNIFLLKLAVATIPLIVLVASITAIACLRNHRHSLWRRISVCLAAGFRPVGKHLMRFP
jgi:hypothetical protein